MPRTSALFRVAHRFGWSAGWWGVALWALAPSWAGADFVVYSDLASFVSGVGTTTLESFESLEPNNDDTALPRVVLPHFRIDMSASDTFGIYDIPNQGTFATDGVQYLRAATGPYSIDFSFSDTLVAFGFDVTDFGDSGSGNLLVEVTTPTGTRLFVVAGTPQPSANRMFFGISTATVPFTELRIIAGADAIGIDGIRFRSEAIGPVTLTFDTLAHTEVLDLQFLDDGVVFEDATVLHSDLFGVPPHSAPSVLNSSLSFRFVEPGDETLPAVTDFVGLFALDVDSLPNGVTAFDAQGAEIEHVAVMGPPFGVREITIASPGIHRVVLEGDGGADLADVFWDNLTYNQVTPIPEPGPATLAMAATLGLFLLTWSRRSGVRRATLP